jgi:glycerol-3-phosphate dehydrogenase (NAD(P)+)
MGPRKAQRNPCPHDETHPEAPSARRATTSGNVGREVDKRVKGRGRIITRSRTRLDAVTDPSIHTRIRATVETMQRTGSKVAVLGAGAWGTALAKVLAEKGDDVWIWARRVELCGPINDDHVNTRYLPDIELPTNLRATSDIAHALKGSDLVVFVAPSHATREVTRLAAPHVPRGVPIVSATKGIENDSLMFMDEVLREELPKECAHQLAFLSGPSFAKELAKKLPTAVVIASHDAGVVSAVMKRFHMPYLRLYASEDVPGVECGGALKNVIAIATGAIDGLGYGMNTRAALITRGLAEIARLAMARGGTPLTLAGLAGMGDLVLTCTGELSRNRTVGLELGRGRKLGEVLASLGHVAEGVKTAKSAYDLSMKLSVDMPIMREVYAVLYDDKPLEKAVVDLMARELGPEFEPATKSHAHH